MRSRPPRLLIIVSRHETLVYAHLSQVFADNAHVEVILDRRVADRHLPERQPIFPGERRQHDISSSLDRLGWAIVRRSTRTWRGRAA